MAGRRNPKDVLQPICEAATVEESVAGRPPDEACSRVTHPERYAVLHEAVLAEGDGLVDRYDIDRNDDVDLAPRAARSFPGSRSVRLAPVGDGAPITLVLTPFPGVAVYAGHAYGTAFPFCGCDACDEQPDDLVERLRQVLADLVAGGLVESRRHRLFRSDQCTIRLESADGAGYSETEGNFDPADHGDLPLGVTHWPAWSRRD